MRGRRHDTHCSAQRVLTRSSWERRHRRRTTRRREIRQLACGFLDVRRSYEAGFLLRVHRHRRFTRCCLMFWNRRLRPPYAGTAVYIRRSALRRPKRRSQRVVGDGVAKRILLLKAFHRRPNSRLSPHEQNDHEQMPQQGLGKRSPGSAGRHENVGPETGGPRRDSRRRWLSVQQQIRQIAQEHTMARFPLNQQLQRRHRCGRPNSRLCDQNPRGFVHGYSLDGEKG